MSPATIILCAGVGVVVLAAAAWLIANKADARSQEHIERLIAGVPGESEYRALTLEWLRDAAFVGLCVAAVVGFTGTLVLFEQANCNAIGNHSAVDSVSYDLFGGCFVDIDGLVMPDDVWREVLLTERTP
jgi:hypothetical protein